MPVLALLAPSGDGKVQQIAATFGINWPHLGAQLVSFAIVCALLYWLAYAPVLRMLDARRAQIAQGLADSEKINTALAGIEAQRQNVIIDAQASATKLLVEARAMARRIEEQHTQRAVAAAEEIVSKAREAAALEHARMLAELRREVGRLVVQTTAAVAGTVLSADDQRRLAENTATYLRTH